MTFRGLFAFELYMMETLETPEMITNVHKIKMINREIVKDRVHSVNRECMCIAVCAQKGTKRKGKKTVPRSEFHQ